MPQATLISHKHGTVVLDVAFDVNVDNYEFFTHELGANVPQQMRKVQTVANPGDTGGGRSKFTFVDLALGITDPTRPWYVRVVAEDGGVRESLISVPGLEITPSSASPNSLKQEIASGNFDGTAGKGLFDFQQKKPIVVERMVANLAAGIPWIFSIKDGDDFEQNIVSGTGAAPLVVEPIRLEVGDRILLKTTGAGGAYNAKITKRAD